MTVSFEEKKPKHPSPVDDFGSATDASRLTASCNVLDPEMAAIERPLPSSTAVVSESVTANSDDSDNASSDDISESDNASDTGDTDDSVLMLLSFSNSIKRAAVLTLNDSAPRVPPAAQTGAAKSTAGKVQNPHLNPNRPPEFLAPPAPVASTAVAVDKPPPPRATPADVLDDKTKSIPSKILLNGYASIVMEQGEFHNRVCLAKEDAKAWPWCVSFAEDLLEIETSRKFDERCCHVMD